MQLKITPFIVDVTPPVGVNLAYRVNKRIHSHIYIRGIVIDDGDTKAVLAACDFLFIAVDAVNIWKNTIAEAIGTTSSRVFIHAIHQHDSLAVFPSLVPLGEKYMGISACSEDYFNRMTENLYNAVKQAVKSWSSVKSMAVAEKRMQGLASNRRLLGADGKVKHMRWSSAPEKLQKEPVGLIDPLLRTVAFLNKNDKVIAALHFYATHPQSVVRGHVTSDVPGAALKYVSEHSSPDTRHIYFTGCGANITFGKYNLADKTKNPPEARIRRLGELLGRGIISNLNRLEKTPAGKIDIKQASFKMPLADFVIKPDLKSLERKIIRQVKNMPQEGCMAVIWPYGIYIDLKKNKKLRHPRLSLIRIGGDINILSMPSETVVEYQLYAQSLLPEKFLACAAYTDCSYMYIPTAAMYKEKGYEPSASVTVPAVEKAYKDAIRKLLS